VGLDVERLRVGSPVHSRRQGAQTRAEAQHRRVYHKSG
jgi:hypothetical protein